MNESQKNPASPAPSNSPVQFKVIPCLSAFHEHDFDPDVIDLFVVLNGRAGLGPLYDAINMLPNGADERVSNPENSIAARAELIFAGFPKSSWRDVRVACGIYSLALKQAAKLGSRKIALMFTSEQFRGDLGELTRALACRTNVFAGLEGEELKLKEVQILCRVQDEERISDGLKPSAKLCTACLDDKPKSRKRS